MEIIDHWYSTGLKNKYIYVLDVEEAADLEEALKMMKSNLSSRPGGVNAELVKHGLGKLHQMLLQLFQRCLNGEDIP
jgi:hypothetical protein